MAKLTSLELWRLADTLSVVNAAILICGGDPSEHYWDNDGERVQGTWQHDGFEAAFSALRAAILTNKLAANVTHALRGGRIGLTYGDQPYEILAEQYEEPISYDMLIARNTGSRNEAPIEGQTVLNFSIDTLRSEKFLYVCKEPNWEQTTVDVIHIQAWLKDRGIYPDFFFPQGSTEGFRNVQNPRYSPKLACAVAAWEAVTKPAKTKSVKQTLQNWIRSNGVSFGVGENSVVSQTAAEEIAKIANWNTKGGATATSTTPDDSGGYEDNKAIQNYSHGYPENLPRDLDIPF